MAKFLRAAIFMACFLCAGSALAEGGTCPSGATYLNLKTNTLVTLSSLGVTSCYYIASNGSDSNDGLSEASGHPWLHAPGMIGCTANCKTLDPMNGNVGSAPPGTGIILRGGDTWGTANLPWTWRSVATSSNPIYLGVDKAWFSGGAWTRPILNVGGVLNNGQGSLAFQWGGSGTANYARLDNIEFTGLYNCGTGLAGSSFYAAMNNTIGILTNSYFHGWTHCPYSAGLHSDGCLLIAANNLGGQNVSYNVFDGSDTTNGGDSCVIMDSGGAPNGVATYAYNYSQYVAGGPVGIFQDVHDNTILFTVEDYQWHVPGAGWHGNGFEDNYECLTSTNPCMFYNNVIKYVCANCGYQVFQAWPQGPPAPGVYDYIFNNVIVDGGGNVINIGGSGGANWGNAVQFNNTIECGPDTTSPLLTPPGGTSTPNASLGGPATFCSGGNNPPGGQIPIQNNLIYNNHFITSSTSPLMIAGYWTASNNPRQSQPAANGQGYALAQTYSFSPTAGRNATVGAGLNLSTICTTISAIRVAAGAACLKDTTYGVSYNTTNHTVISPARTPVARPSSGAWDAGAYQFSVSAVQAPQPPTNLQAGVQ